MSLEKFHFLVEGGLMPKSILFTVYYGLLGMVAPHLAVTGINAEALNHLLDTLLKVAAAWPIVVGVCRLLKATAEKEMAKTKALGIIAPHAAVIAEYAPKFKEFTEKLDQSVKNSSEAERLSAQQLQESSARGHQLSRIDAKVSAHTKQIAKIGADVSHLGKEALRFEEWSSRYAKHAKNGTLNESHLLEQIADRYPHLQEELAEFYPPTHQNFAPHAQQVETPPPLGEGNEE